MRTSDSSACSERKGRTNPSQRRLWSVEPGSRRQLVAGLAAAAILVVLAVVAAVASLRGSTHSAIAATEAFERDLADVRAVRHAARDLRAAGRSYVAHGDRLAISGARGVLGSATDRLHDARFATVVRDARALAMQIASSTASENHDLAAFDAMIEHATRTLALSSDTFIAGEQLQLAAKLESLARAATRAELVAGVLTLVGLAAMFGCVATFLRTVQRVPPLQPRAETEEPARHSDPTLLT